MIGARSNNKGVNVDAGHLLARSSQAHAVVLVIPDDDAFESLAAALVLRADGDDERIVPLSRAEANRLVHFDKMLDG